MTCGFVSCVDADECALVDGCVRLRFPSHFVAKMKPVSDLKSSAPALNGVLPARTNRDPTKIKRKRKAIWKA